MERETVPEDEILKQDLLEVLQKVEADRKLEKDYIPDRERQKEIINNLPNNFLQRLRGYYLARNLKNNQGALTEFNGEFTEMLVRAEVEPLSPQAGIILELMRNPKRFAIKRGWKSLINPDTVYIRAVSQEDGSKRLTLIIEQVGEIKKGPLNLRALAQLGENGFKKSFKKLEQILGREEIANHPVLSVLYQAKIVLGSNFTQMLFITAEKDPKNPKSLLSDKARKDPNHQNILSSAIIKKIPFSSQEISAMARFLWEKI